MSGIKSRKTCKKGSATGFHRSTACRSRSPANEPTHFFKVILPSTMKENKLRIPEKFGRKFGNELSAVSTVTTPNGCMWKLGLHKSEKSILFSHGWQEFVEHHSISTGYFLVFRYEGNSNFHVLIFDMTATEIEYPPNDQTNHAAWVGLSSNHSSCVQKDRKISGSIMLPADSSTPRESRRFPKLRALQNHGRSISEGAYDTRSKKRKVEILEEIIRIDDDMNASRRGNLELTPVSMPVWSPEDEGVGQDVPLTRSICYYSNRKSVTPEQRQDAIIAAKMFRPKNPHFMAVLRPSHIYNASMCVPAKFASKFLRGNGEVLNLQCSDKPKWKTRFYYAGGCHRIGKGWTAFARYNKLEDGDVCIFELIKGKKIAEMKVEIFHASDFR